MRAFNIITLDETTSTNHYMLDLLASGAPEEWTVVAAASQTEGRGVDGSRWESEKGKNLTFSLLIYPNYISVEFQFYLNKAISLGVLDLVREVTGQESFIKWPNDIYIGRRKVAGILIQNGIRGNRFSYCVAGIGLNVNQEKFLKEAPNPVSLRQVTGREYDLELLLPELCGRIATRLDMLKSGQQDILDRDYLSSLFRMNEVAHYVYQGREISARITGVSRYGQLVLELPEKKLIECDLKEIRFQV